MRGLISAKGRKLNKKYFMLFFFWIDMSVALVRWTKMITKVMSWCLSYSVRVLCRDASAAVKCLSSSDWEMSTLLKWTTIFLTSILTTCKKWLRVTLLFSCLPGNTLPTMSTLNSRLHPIWSTPWWTPMSTIDSLSTLPTEWKELRHWKRNTRCTLALSEKLKSNSKRDSAKLDNTVSQKSPTPLSLTLRRLSSSSTETNARLLDSITEHFWIDKTTQDVRSVYSREKPKDGTPTTHSTLDR